MRTVPLIRWFKGAILTAASPIAERQPGGNVPSCINTDNTLPSCGNRKNGSGEVTAEDFNPIEKVGPRPLEFNPGFKAVCRVISPWVRTPMAPSTCAG